MPFERTIRYLIALAAIAAACFSALFAYASYKFQQDTPNSVGAAVRLVPYDATYLARLAELQPEQKIALLERAVSVNPFDARSWIQLGLTKEMEQRDIAGAANCYRRAAEVNHMFLPKWTLTNFYFRRERPFEFFHWARATLEITPYSPTPVFTELWLMSQDAVQIAKAIPNRPRILLLYADFLSHSDQWSALPPIVERLISAAGRSNPRASGRDGFIGPMEDRLLGAGHLAPALQIWSSMKDGGWIRLSVPTRAQPLTNGDFAAPFWGHGFDWSVIAAAGVTVDQIGEQKEVRLTLSGSEPEHCSLLQEYVPVEPGGGYRLEWEADGRGVENPSGLAWRLSGVDGKSQVSLVSGDLLASVHAWNFTAPAEAELLRLTLDYSRPFGSTVANGTIDLRSISLREQR